MPWVRSSLRHALELVGVDYESCSNPYPHTLAPDAVVFLTRQAPPKVMGPGVVMLAAFPLSGDSLGDYVLNKAIVYEKGGEQCLVLEWG